MRILQIAHGFPPDLIGGTERYVEALSLALSDRGHEVRVLAGSIEFTGKVQTRETTHRGLSVLRVQRGDLYFDHWDKAYNPHVSAIVAECCKTFKPDVVHGHHWVRLSADALRIAASMGIPTLCTLHDFYVTCPRAFRLRQEAPCDLDMGIASCLDCVPRWSFQRDPEIATSIESYARDVAAEVAVCKVAIAPSRAHKDALERFQPALKGKLEVIAHPRLDLLSKAPRSKTGEKLRIGCWSHLHPLKGQDLLLEAVSSLENPASVVIDLWGEAVLDDYRAKLESLARGLCVVFHGRYRPEDLPRHPIDIAVIATTALETYSFILDEAAALGAPIVSSNVGALEERATGRVELFRRGDSKDLARVLGELLSDPERRHRMEEAPAPPILEIDDHVSRVEGLYDRVLSHSRSTVPSGDSTLFEGPTFQRLCREWDRRETAFQELLRSEGWERVIAEKNASIESLRRGGEAKP